MLGNLRGWGRAGWDKHTVTPASTKRTSAPTQLTRQARSEQAWADFHIPRFIAALE